MRAMKIFLIFFSLVVYSKNSFCSPAALRYSPQFLLMKTLELKKLQMRSDIEVPLIRFESQTALVDFQDAVEKQWGFRPGVFSNAYSVEKNQIFISDNEDYYSKNGRCMDDSVVHELTHYLQVKYQKWDLNDESLEWDAIEKQTQFRELYCK